MMAIRGRYHSRKNNKIRDGQVFILSTDYCKACDELLNHKYIKDEVEKGNIIVLKEGDKLYNEICSKIKIDRHPVMVVYYDGIGFVDEDTAIKLENQWAKHD